MGRVAAARSRALLLPRAAAALSSSYPGAAASLSSSAPSSYPRAAPSSSSYAYRVAAAAAAEAAAAASGAGGEAAEAAQRPLAARKGWVRGLLKVGVLATLAGVVGGAGYATHAYSLAEVDEKTLAFRKQMTTPIPVAENASEFEKFRARAYGIAVKVPVQSIELYLEVRDRIEDHVLGSQKLLPDLQPEAQHMFTLVIDLDETLIHSDWEPETGLKIFKRPGVEAFLQYMSTMYEVVVYSDQLQMHVERAVGIIDTTGRIHRLSRPATKYRSGKHVRDLSKLNRNPARVLYISAHALDSCLQKENCLDIKPWKLETDDTELLDLIPFLEYNAVLSPPDIREVVASFQGHDVVKEFYERCKIMERNIEKIRKQQKIDGIFRRPRP